MVNSKWGKCIVLFPNNSFLNVVRFTGVVRCIVFLSFSLLSHSSALPLSAAEGAPGVCALFPSERKKSADTTITGLALAQHSHGTAANTEANVRIKLQIRTHLSPQGNVRPCTRWSVCGV